MKNQEQDDEDIQTISTELYTAEASESRKVTEKELEISDPEFEVAKAAINANSK